MLYSSHIKTSEECRNLANARSVGAARDILLVIERERDRLRNENESKPEGELANIKLAQINALNWVLDLPRKAKEHIEKLPEGE